MYHPHHENTEPPRRGMRANGEASIAELRAFLAQARGRSPQEVLGLIAASGLARGMFLSTILIAVVVFVGTAVPFAHGKLFGDATNSGAGAAKAPAKDNDTEPPTPPEKKTETVDAKTPAKKTAEEDILDKLGIGETKPVPKGINPLEGRAEDILKDLGGK